jgi:hypothetical protein
MVRSKSGLQFSSRGIKPTYVVAFRTRLQTCCLKPSGSDEEKKQTLIATSQSLVIVVRASVPRMSSSHAPEGIDN